MLSAAVRKRGEGLLDTFWLLPRKPLDGGALPGTIADRTPTHARFPNSRLG